MNLYDIIQHPLVTEKSSLLAEQGKYFFRVHPDAGKHQIKLAVEKAFSVKVEKVNTVNVRGKKKRVRYEAGYAPNWKKAIVKLKQGEKIDYGV